MLPRASCQGAWVRVDKDSDHYRQQPADPYNGHGWHNFLDRKFHSRIYFRNPAFVDYLESWLACFKLKDLASFKFSAMKLAAQQPQRSKHTGNFYDHPDPACTDKVIASESLSHIIATVHIRYSKHLQNPFKNLLSGIGLKFKLLYPVTDFFCFERCLPIEMWLCIA